MYADQILCQHGTNCNHLERGKSIEKLPPSDLPADKSMGHFLWPLTCYLKVFVLFCFFYSCLYEILDNIIYLSWLKRENLSECGSYGLNGVIPWAQDFKSSLENKTPSQKNTLLKMRVYNKRIWYTMPNKYC